MWQIVVIIAAAIISYFVPTPQEMRNAFVSGQNYYAAKDYKNALKQYDLILNTESALMAADSVKVQLLNNELKVSVRNAASYQKANTFKQLENPDSAIHYFRIVSTNKDEPDIAVLAQFQIYDIYYKLRKYEQCISEAYKLIQNFSNNKKSEQAFFDIGWSYRELKKLDSSSIAFRSLITNYPQTEYYARSLYQIAQNEFELGKYDQAITDWKLLIEKFRPSIFTAKDWEKVELKAEKERKIFEATQDREVETSDLELVAKAYVKVGDAYSAIKKYPEAIQSYRMIITTYTLLPSLQEICWIKIADATFASQNIEEAVDIYKEAIDNNFNNKRLQAKMQYKIAELYQNNRMFIQSAAAFDFYINSFGETAEAIGFGTDKAKLSQIAALYNGKDFDGAITASDTFISKYEISDLISSVYFLKGSSLIAKREYSLAKQSFTKLVNDYPKSSDIVNANIQLGFINYKEGNLEKALENYNYILTEYADRIDSSEVYYNLLLVYSDLKRDKEALNSFKYVKFGSSFYHSAFGKVIKILTGKNEFAKADSLINDVKKLDEKNSEINYAPYINFTLADVNIAKRDYNSAIINLSSVISDTTLKEQNNSLKLQSYYARGILYNQIQNYTEAIKDLDYILKDQVFISSYGNLVPNLREKLAIAYSKTGKLDEAIKLINLFYATSKTTNDSAKVKSLIANMYYEAKEYKKSIDLSQELTKANITDTNLIIQSYINISNSYKYLNDYNKAGSTLIEASERFPKSEETSQVLYSLGGLYFDLQQYDKSAEYFTKFLIQYPEHTMTKEGNYFQAFAYFQAGKWEQAVKSFKDFVAKYPEDKASPEFQHYAGEAYFNAKNFDKAIAEYQITYKKFEKSEYAVIAMYNEGWCYFQEKNFAKMIEVFKNLSEKYPNSSYAGNALFTIGDHYYNNKDYPKATEYYDLLVKKFPKYERIEEAKSLIKELSQINSFLEFEIAMKPFDLGNYEQAIGELKKVIEKYPNDDIVVACSLNIASAYSQLGQTQTAYSIFKVLKEKYESDANQLEAYLFAKGHVEYIEAKRQMQSGK